MGPDNAPTPQDTDSVCNWRLWWPPWPGNLAYFARALILPVEIENNSKYGHWLERP